MKPVDPKRSLATEGLVCMSVCAAAYFFLVDPASTKLGEVRGQLRQTSAMPAPTPGAAITPDEARKIMDEVQVRVAEVEARSGPARDESALFASMMALAAAHNIRVDGLSPVGAAGDAGKGRKQPGGAGTAPPPPPPPGVEAPEPVPVDTSVEFLMSTVCNYADLVRFVDALQRMSGYTVIKSIRLEPADDNAPDRVHATIGTIHLAFDTSTVIVRAPDPGGAP